MEALMMIHVLHDKQTRILKDFLTYFFKPQTLPTDSKKLVSLN